MCPCLLQVGGVWLGPLQELCAELEEVCADPHGSRVLLYLLSPRSPRHFKRSFCALLEGGDGNKYRWVGQGRGRVGCTCMCVVCAVWCAVWCAVCGVCSVSVSDSGCSDDQS